MRRRYCSTTPDMMIWCGCTCQHLLGAEVFCHSVFRCYWDLLFYIQISGAWANNLLLSITSIIFYHCVARVITHDCAPSRRLCIRSLLTEWHTTLPGCHDYIPATALSFETRVGEFSRYISLTHLVRAGSPAFYSGLRQFSAKKRNMFHTHYPPPPCSGALR